MNDARKRYIAERIKVLEDEIARLRKELLDAGVILTQPEHARGPWSLTGNRGTSPTSNDNENTIPEHFD
jgi:hypothetical protein